MNHCKYSLEQSFRMMYTCFVLCLSSYVLCLMSFGVMFHLGLCRLGLSHIRDYVVWDFLRELCRVWNYVTFGIDTGIHS